MENQQKEDAMGIFKGLFDFEKKREINREINLMEAIKAHIDWKIRLQKCLEGTSEEELDAAVVCRDDQCQLGKWIHGPAQHHFGGGDAYHSLREDHAHFHLVAGKIVTHVQSGEHEVAGGLMENEYRQASLKVVLALAELNSELEL
jgi:hypothetical protein